MKDLKKSRITRRNQRILTGLSRSEKDEMRRRQALDNSALLNEKKLKKKSQREYHLSDYMVGKATEWEIELNNAGMGTRYEGWSDRKRNQFRECVGSDLDRQRTYIIGYKYWVDEKLFDELPMGHPARRAYDLLDIRQAIMDNLREENHKELERSIETDKRSKRQHKDTKPFGHGLICEKSA